MYGLDLDCLKTWTREEDSIPLNNDYGPEALWFTLSRNPILTTLMYLILILITTMLE